MPSLKSKMGRPRTPKPLKRHRRPRWEPPQIHPVQRMRRTSRRTRLIGAALLVVAAVGAFEATRPPDLRKGSVVVSGKGSGPAITKTPSAYELVYRVESFAAGKTTIATDRVWVRRPFDSRLEEWSGAPPGRKKLSEQVTNFGRLGTAHQGSSGTRLQVPPGIAGSDLRADAALLRALKAKSVERREERRVAGRLCRVYRAGGPINAGDVVAYKKGAEEYADACIDGSGFLLEEFWYLKGKPLRRRLAVSVQEEPKLDDALFALPEGTDLDRKAGGGLLKKLSDDSRPPGMFWELPATPEGWELYGRYAVLPPQAQSPTDPMAGDRQIASVADVYVKGADVVIVDRGGTLASTTQPLGKTPGSTKVNAGELGDGELIVDFRSSEVRVQPKSGGFIRVLGTIAPERLLELARTMHQVEGGTLTPIE
jgi:hypothetical protein